MAVDLTFTSTGIVTSSTNGWLTSNAVQPPIREREADTPKVTECKGCGRRRRNKMYLLWYSEI